ncbi:MAG: aminoglycoside phosphotransferase family protein [Clostridiales bacterium]|nr:aminoglycoside phosphotransferase family protein [Clostridiales bacterium]
MISRTKFEIDEASVLRLFEAAGIAGVTRSEPLGDGEFNAVFLAASPERSYVLKIAPPDGAPVMTYERDMMRSEVFWYDVMRKRTSIRVPEVYAADFSRTRLPVPYFIMEHLRGEPLNKARLNEAERAEADAALARMAAELHAVKSERFGYEQCGLYENWYEAVSAFVRQTLDDCAHKRRRSRRGERLLRLIERHRDALSAAESCMVNFDIWPANIIVSRETGAVRLAWIDPERSFWGDKMLDFVCFAFHRPLASKRAVLAAYNAAAEQAVAPTHGEEIRFAVGQAYLALIMETEKYYRYSPLRFGWWRNVLAARMLYRAAFSALEA